MLLKCFKYNGTVLPHVNLRSSNTVIVKWITNLALFDWQNKHLDTKCLPEKRMTSLCFPAPGKVYEKQQKKNPQRACDTKPV